MKKYLLVLNLVFILSLNSCLALMVPEILRNNKANQNIEIVKKSYLEGFSQKYTIEETLKKFSKNNFKWGHTTAENYYLCKLTKTFRDINTSKPSKLRHLILVIYFKYNEETKKVIVSSIRETLSTTYKWYRTPEEIKYVLNLIYY